ncbi:hypothetical protein [Acidimangrovimonas sediminis]|uniref:hypothetical protein n=1 Tax=Acidimangrovimonas sediminis TaxID=2056283 RepID=UPI000C802D91|nr:hypothetical protein [Acidimangrovimonas sediminis]
MDYAGLDDFFLKGRDALSAGPVALVFAEDRIEVNSCVRHNLDAGFEEVLVFCPEGVDFALKISGKVHRIPYDVYGEGALVAAVNRVIEQAPGIWLYYCYNAEYLFHPFCETRNIREMLAFHTEERRDAVLTYVVDLYAGDLGRHHNAVSLEEAMMDRTGYYALARRDPGRRGEPKERQLDFFGGLRWRFEEHIPKARRKIDRIALFRAKKGLHLRPDHTFDDEEYNTYACPWHHNITAAIASFRTAKALKTNPGSTFDIPTFRWHNSIPFQWHSKQLMDLGLMEPGQWF